MNAMQPLAGALPRDQSDDGALLRPNYEDVVDRAAEFRLTCARVPPELADAADTARALIANAETNTMDGEDAFVDAEIARLRQAQCLWILWMVQHLQKCFLVLKLNKHKLTCSPLVVIGS